MENVFVESTRAGVTMSGRDYTELMCKKIGWRGKRIWVKIFHPMPSDRIETAMYLRAENEKILNYYGVQFVENLEGMIIEVRELTTGHYTILTRISEINPEPDSKCFYYCDHKNKCKLGGECYGGKC